MQDGFILSMDTAQCSQIALYDNGGLSRDYAPGQHSIMRVVSRPGTYMEILFTYFESEFPNDRLLIFDGSDTTAPLIAELSGSPFTISALFYSSADTITLLFLSDTDTLTYGGFSAIITQLGQAPARLTMGSTPAKTFRLPACTPYRFVMYDPGGATGNYPPSFCDTLVFVPAPSSFIAVSWPYQFTLASGDTLFIYAGSSAAPDSLLAFFTNGTHRGDTLTVPLRDVPLSVVFRSDQQQEAPGWQAWIWCTDSIVPSIIYSGGKGVVNLNCTAPVKVYDDGSPWLLRHRQHYTHYSSEINSAFTFLVRDSSMVPLLRFSLLNIGDSLFEDELTVYDGWDTGGVVLLRAGTSPALLRNDSIVALSQALTLALRSTNSITAAGWEGVAQCARKRTYIQLSLHQPSDSISTCHALITDPGGAYLPYSFSGKATAKVCPSGELYLRAKMLGGYELAEGDTLIVYAVSPHAQQQHLIALLTGTSGYELISTHKPNQCLLFELHGQGTDSAKGWTATIECTWEGTPWQTWTGEGLRRTCQAHIYDRGGPWSFYREAGTPPILSMEAPANATLFSHYWEMAMGDSILISSPAHTIHLTGSLQSDTPLITHTPTVTVTAHTNGKQKGWWWEWHCEEYVKLVLSASGDVSICPGDTLTLTAQIKEGNPTAVERIVWNTGEQSPTIIVREPGYYWACAHTLSGLEFCSPVLHASGRMDDCILSSTNSTPAPNPATHITVKWAAPQILEVSGVPAGANIFFFDIKGKLLLSTRTAGNTLKVKAVDAGVLVIEMCTDQMPERCRYILAVPPAHAKLAK